MPTHNLTEIEEELIKKYQLTKDEDIAMYFFNKMGKDILDIIYSKVNLKFSGVPFEKEDLTCFVWKNLKTGLELYKREKKNLWSVWLNGTYYSTIKEIKKYFTNSELIMNHADSWENYSANHCVLKCAPSAIDMPKQSFKNIIDPIIDYVSKHNKKYTKTSIRRLMYLKSFGFSEREIAKKMNVSRRYITSMIKLVLRISKRYLSASNR